jgi:5-methylcytosine-specific restriction endonuclease McrA
VIAKKPHGNLGKKRSAATRKLISEVQIGRKHKPETIEKFKGRIPWNKGMRGYKSGANHYRWKPDRTPKLNSWQLKGSTEYKGWRTLVFNRDSYMCQECGQQGGDLEAHHIVPVRTAPDKIYIVANGITLCRPCHLKTLGKEEHYIDRYTEMLTPERNLISNTNRNFSAKEGVKPAPGPKAQPGKHVKAKKSGRVVKTGL